MRAWLLCVCVAAGLTAAAKEFTGPDAWRLVNTNAVNAWNAAQRKQVQPSCKAYPGVVADTQKREVRLLAEAVGIGSASRLSFFWSGQ